MNGSTANAVASPAGRAVDGPWVWLFWVAVSRPRAGTRGCGPPMNSANRVHRSVCRLVRSPRRCQTRPDHIAEVDAKVTHYGLGACPAAAGDAGTGMSGRAYQIEALRGKPVTHIRQRTVTHELEQLAAEVPRVTALPRRVEALRV